MADKSGIEWTDATWNPITGCSVVSPGCTNCYAMKLAGTRMKHHPSRAGLTDDSKAGPVWNGKVRLNEQWLDQPLRWRKPRLIFVCAHGDLFHEAVPDAWIDRVFAVMALAPQHTFQVLTKRAERMREYLQSWGDLGYRWCTAAHDIINGDPGAAPRFPLPNVWLGTSAEDQQRADARIPPLLDTPAAVRFISAEPLLGPVEIKRHFSPTETHGIDLSRDLGSKVGACVGVIPALDWVIAGGESGPGARPMHPDWARSLRDQCAAAGVPFHFKQWGAWGPVADIDDDAGMTKIADHTVELQYGDLWVEENQVALLSPAGVRWENDQAQPPPRSWVMERIGKKAAGRLLDGRTHDGMPLPKPPAVTPEQIVEKNDERG